MRADIAKFVAVGDIGSLNLWTRNFERLLLAFFQTQLAAAVNDQVKPSS